MTAKPGPLLAERVVGLAASHEEHRHFVLMKVLRGPEVIGLPSSSDFFLHAPVACSMRECSTKSSRSGACRNSPAGRCIIFTTHYLEEADILANRKARCITMPFALCLRDFSACVTGRAGTWESPSRGHFTRVEAQVCPLARSPHYQTPRSTEY